VDFDKIREVGTCGACGVIAKAVLENVGGIPHLKYNPQRVPTHAAVKIDGLFYHLGDDDEDLEEVSMEEFEEALEGFEPDRFSDEEIQEAIDFVLQDLLER